MKGKITKDEVKRRLGYFFIGLSGAYLAPPLEEFINNTIGNINPLLVGIVLFVGSLYLFDF